MDENGQLNSESANEAEIQMLFEKEPIVCTSINLSRNSLTDEAIGVDFLKILQKRKIKVITLDLSKNHLGKLTLIRLREFFENASEDLTINKLDLSDN